MNLVHQITNFKLQHSLIFSLLIVLLIITIAGLLQVVFVYLFSKLAHKYKTKNLTSLVRSFRIPILLLSIIVGMSIGMPLLRFPSEIQIAIEHVLSIASIITATWLITNFVDIFRTLIIHKYDTQNIDNFRARRIYTQLKVITRIVNGFILVIALAAILMTFDRIRDVGYSILVSAGVGAAIIGFAAQKSLASLLAGLQVALTQPIRIGDVVVIEGEWGIIEEINLSYVVVRIWDKRRLVIPISFFLEKSFQNWSRQSTDLLGTVMIYTDYSIQVDDLRKELTQILAHDPLWDKQASAIQVTDAKTDVLELRVLVSARNAGDLFSLRCNVRERLINYISKNYPKSLPRTRVALATHKKPKVELASGGGQQDEQKN